MYACSRVHKHEHTAAHKNTHTHVHTGQTLNISPSDAIKCSHSVNLRQPTRLIQNSMQQRVNFVNIPTKEEVYFFAVSHWHYEKKQILGLIWNDASLRFPKMLWNVHRSYTAARHKPLSKVRAFMGVRRRKKKEFWTIRFLGEQGGGEESW